MVNQTSPQPDAKPAFTTLPPFRIEPIFVPRVWGSKTLRPWFPIDAPDNPIGEVWLTGDQCLVATGPAAGLTLAALADFSPRALLGHDLETTPKSGSSTQAATSNSPLLIKLIFAQQKLSVQVHPDDILARSQGFPRGKTECWYVLAAEPNAQVAVGFKPALVPTLTRDEIRHRAIDGSLEACLKILPVAQGDMILVDAGTVHAIFPGSVLLEVQQNSDTTYRLFDYGRPRELHIEKSLEALKFTTHAGKISPQILSDRTKLINTEDFSIDALNFSIPLTSQSLRTSGHSDHQPAKLSYLFVNKGSATISSINNHFPPIELPEHAILAIPATAPEFLIQPHAELELVHICS